MQKQVVLLTNRDGSPILIGVESIIDVKECIVPDLMEANKKVIVTKIQSRGAMVETNYVTEGVIDIYNLIND